MTSSNAKILLALLGIGLVVVAIFLVARPKNEDAKEIWTRLVEVLKSTITDGKAGRYISVHIGANAQSIPNVMTYKTYFDSDINFTC